MGINWLLVTDTRFKYFRDRNLHYLEMNIDNWHYWVFYQTQIEEIQIEAVFFVQEKIAAFQKDTAINFSFHVPAMWLENTNNRVFQILKENLSSQLTQD